MLNETRELQVLEKEMDKIIEQARAFGLDFFPMRFELVPAHVIYNIGAYGMHTRFSHWSFGKLNFPLVTEKTEYRFHVVIMLSASYHINSSNEKAYF